MSGGAKRRLLLVDDHKVFAECLGQALDSQGSFHVVLCSSSQQTLELLRRDKFDLVLLDFDLGSETVVSLVRKVAAECSDAPRIAVLTAGLSLAAARQLTAFPFVRGLLIKDTSLAKLVESIEALLRDQSLLDNRYAAALLPPSDSRVSQRQQEVMRCLVEGLSNKEIGTTLFLSETTVKNTLRSLFRRYGVRTRSQLVRVALESDLYEPGS